MFARRLVGSLLICTACGRGPFWGFGEQPRVSCDRADFLFVIDNSGSMREHQRQLTENFPVFIDGIHEVVDRGVDIHLGVVTTDRYAGNHGDCHELGSLVTRTTGPDSSTSVCGPFAEGRPYMTSADDLPRAFACAAHVGTAGDSIEQPLAAALGAIDPRSAAAKCNSGFLRDDALLSIVALSDENDQSPGSVDSYVDAFAAIKGSPEAFALVTLVESLCGDRVCNADRLRDAAAIAEFGFSGTIGGDYAEQFTSAVELIDDACEANER